jgi:hypothetical protein
MRRPSNYKDTAEGRSRSDPHKEFQTTGPKVACRCQIRRGDAVGLPLFFLLPYAGRADVAEGHVRANIRPRSILPRTCHLYQQKRPKPWGTSFCAINRLAVTDR